ncbi:MAG: transposase [Gemmatimonadota bacterium]
MGRARRLHAPSTGLHITARTQNRAKWFDESMRGDIVAIIREGVSSFGHLLLAFVVMPNHFHIVMKQGQTPLGWAMQRIMQRTAHRVKRLHDVDGHVFGQPYWSIACGDPRYLRTAIIYTHLNPCAAGLCVKPEEYAWSSHSSYVNLPGADAECFDATAGLMLFARESLHRADLIADYTMAVDLVIRQRAVRIPGDWYLPNSARLRLNATDAGDAHWATSYSPAPAADVGRACVADLRDRVIAILRKLDPECDIDTLRHAGRRKTLAGLRRQVIAILLTDGYRGSDIARCLRVSPALVSRIRADMRIGRS